MTRVFFGFNWQEDMRRAAQVRDCWLTSPDRTAAGCFDVAVWEAARNEGVGPFPGLGLRAIKKMIDEELEGTSVTAVLVGTNTAGRRYIDYEIERSLERGNALLAIHINELGDDAGLKSPRGRNPFDDWLLTPTGEVFREVNRTYDWVADDGCQNCAAWFGAAGNKSPHVA